MQLHTALHRAVAATLQLAPEKVCIRAFPQGGSFGAKRSVYKYVVMASLLSIRTGRPIKWIEDRVEHLVASSTHGPDRFYNAEMALAPPSQGSVGSRGGVATAGAVLAAAKAFKEKAVQVAASHLHVDPGGLEWQEGYVRVASSPTRVLLLAEIASKTPLQVDGSWLSPAQGLPDEQGRLHSYATAAAAAHVAVVEVDTETGYVRILRICCRRRLWHSS